MQKIFAFLSFFVIVCLQIPLQGKSVDSLRFVIKNTANEKVEYPLLIIGNSTYLGDEDGHLMLPKTLIKNTLQFKAMSYSELRIEASQLDLNQEMIEIVLKPESYTLDKIEILGHKQNAKTINPNEGIRQVDLNQLAGISLGDAIKNIKGVQLLRSGANVAKPVLHGMHSNRLLILNDDVKQRGQEWGMEHGTDLDVWQAEEIIVVKGAEGVKYGKEAMGGAVIVQSPKLKTDSVIYGSIRTLLQSNGKGISTAFRLGGHHKKLPAWAWMAQAALKKRGNLKTADYFLENTGMKEWSAALQLSYIKEHFQSDVQYSFFQNNLGILKSSHIGSLEDLEYHIKNGRPLSKGIFEYAIRAPNQEVVHHIMKWRNHLHLSDYVHLNINYAYQNNNRREFDIRRAGRTEIPAVNLSLSSHDLKLEMDAIIKNLVDVDAGLVTYHEENKNVPGTFTTPIIPDYIENQFALYGLGKMQWRKWEFQLGLRKEIIQNNAKGYNQHRELYGENKVYNDWSMSLATAFLLNKNWTFLFSSNTSWRPPHVQELYSTGLHHGAAAIEIGNSTLKKEKAWKNVFSIEAKLKDGWQLSSEIYAHLFHNYIYLNPSNNYQQTISGAFPIYNFMQDDAYFLGGDLSSNWKIINSIHYNFMFSWIHAEKMNDKGFLPDIPSHKLRNNITYEKQWNPVFPDFRIHLEHEWVLSQNKYDSSQIFAPAPPAYHLFHFSASNSWQWKKHTLQLALQIDNLFNVLYKDYLNRNRYFAHEIGRNIQIRINYTF